jgi:hypothetical protein
MSIYEDLIQLHEDLIEFGSGIQSKSATKFKKEKHIESNVHAVFYKVIAYGIILHRAAKTLCENGWTHVTPILLRTIMECSVNCLAIIHNDYAEYMAFKYFYHDYVEILRDNNSSHELKAKNLSDIEKGLEHIKNLAAKEKAVKFVENDKLEIFWFRPDESGVSSIIKKHGSDGLTLIYRSFSKSIHASHIGMFLLKDDPDNIEINPCENPVKTNLAIIISCRLLLELINIRINYEDLGFDTEYKGFLERILAFENKVRY